tara:strand:- start:7359 stop:7556 length:198 start_codon:yes stop_codon:yes gene_type:complete
MGHASGSLFGLASGGVYLALMITHQPVRSYRTLSPLPTNKLAGGLLSAALVVSSRYPGVTWHPTL